MVKVIRQIVPPHVRRSKTSPGTSRILGIAVHETANTSRGAGAKAHANLQSNGNSRQASWHYQVDDTVAYQSFEDTDRCWHAGDGDRRNGSHYIAIEICVNSDSNYEKALKNAQELIASKIHEHNLTIDDVKQHHYFSGKHCPAIMRSRGLWREFIQGIGADELGDIMSWYRNKEEFEHAIASRILRYTNPNVVGGHRQVYTHIRKAGDNESLIRAIGRLVGSSQDAIIQAINEANEQ